MDMNKILFITDVDGTLTDAGRLSAENEAAIREFQRRGGLFTLATGRTLSYVRESYGGRLTPNAPIVAVNGSIIYDHRGGTVLWKKPFPPNLAEVIGFIRSITAPSLIRLCGESSQFDGLSGERIGDEILKAVTVTETEDDAVRLMNALNESGFENCHTTRSWPTGVETTNREAGKGICVGHVKELCGADFCIAMGDFENDCGMLRSADLGIAVGNAPDNVKACADAVTVTVSENAVAHVLENIEQICSEYMNQTR